MKKSTIIAAAFGAFIVLSMLAFYIDAKNHEGKENKESELNRKEFKINDFKVLVAEKGADVHFIPNDTAKLTAEIEKDSVLRDKLYEQRGDTLYVYAGKRLYAYGKSLKSVISRNAEWIGIHPYSTDTLKLNLQGSEVYINFNDNNHKSEYNYIEISADNKAQIWFRGNLTVKKTSLKVKNTTVGLYDGNFGEIDTKLENRSELKMGQVLNSINTLRVDKDSTSQVSY